MRLRRQSLRIKLDRETLFLDRMSDEARREWGRRREAAEQAKEAEQAASLRARVTMQWN
jgi:hypothetical protein